MGPRHGGARSRPGARPPLRADRYAERRPALRPRPCRARPAGASATVAGMTPGEIRFEHVTRTFRVYPEPARTLKELIVSRGRVRATEIVALKDVSVEIQR